MTDASLSLSEAVTKFVAGRKNAKKEVESHHELGTFIWAPPIRLGSGEAMLRRVVYT